MYQLGYPKKRRMSNLGCFKCPKRGKMSNLGCLKCPQGGRRIGSPHLTGQLAGTALSVNILTSKIKSYFISQFMIKK